MKTLCFDRANGVLEERRNSLAPSLILYLYLFIVQWKGFNECLLPKLSRFEKSISVYSMLIVASCFLVEWCHV